MWKSTLAPSGVSGSVSGCVVARQRHPLGLSSSKTDGWLPRREPAFSNVSLSAIPRAGHHDAVDGLEEKR